MTPLPRQFTWPATSEQIRASLGILTPAERAAQARREAAEAHRKAREAAQGVPLFGEDQP